MITEKTTNNLVKFKQLIQAANYGFLHTLQLTTKEALDVGAALREAKISPFSRVTPAELTWAISHARDWWNYTGPTLGYNLTAELTSGSGGQVHAGNRIAPILAALGCAVYEYASEKTGEIDWVVMASYEAFKSTETAQKIIANLKKQGWIDGSTFTQITQDTWY